MKLIDRYNEYYNDECASLPHGMPVSMEHMQAITIRAALYAFARKYGMKDKIYVEDLELLAKQIEAQGNKSIQKHQTVMKVAQERHGKDLDIL
jgi:vancomycin resistance protein YoaR